MTTNAIVLSSFTALCLWGQDAPRAKAPEAPIESPTKNQEIDLTLDLPAGEAYIVNFLVNVNAAVTAKFSKTSALEVIPFAHPKSDLIQKGDELSIQCPGVGAHEVMPIASGVTDNVEIKSKQMGHYGFLWRNTSKAKVTLSIHLTLSPQVIITGHTGAQFIRK